MGFLKWKCFDFENKLIALRCLTEDKSSLEYILEDKPLAKAVTNTWYVAILFQWDIPDSKVYGANVGTTWVLSAPDGPHEPCYQG